MERYEKEAADFEVSEEQRRRMALRGERPMMYDEIIAAYTNRN